MANEWYYAVDNRQQGPISHQEFKLLIKDKTIGADTLVWRAGMAQWQPLSQVIRGKTQAPPTAAGTETAAAPGNAGSGPADAAHHDPTSAMDTAVAGAEPVREQAGDPEPGPMQACAECGRTFAREDLLTYGDTHICASCKPVFVQKLREGVGITGSYVYGGFWIRFVAKFVDGIIQTFAVAILTLPFDMTVSAHSGPSVVTSLLVLVVNLALPAAYTTFFLGRYSATPGKMACRLQVITSDGGQISYARALGRHCCEMLSSVILLIGYIMAAFDEEKRTLHDRICDTRVVRRG